MVHIYIVGAGHGLAGVAQQDVSHGGEAAHPLPKRTALAWHHQPVGQISALDMHGRRGTVHVDMDAKGETGHCKLECTPPHTIGLHHRLDVRQRLEVVRIACMPGDSMP